MPLSPPGPRAPIHTRSIVCNGFRREDGLWDLEGRLIDSKSYAFGNVWRSRIEPGEALHEMLVRLTVDDDMTVVAIEAASDATPHGSCGAIIPNFQRIVGERIGAGWRKRVMALIGGREGCAHHVEVICQLANLAFQTMGPVLARERAAAGTQAGESPNAKFLVDSCHVWRADGEWAQRFARDPEGTLADRQRPIEEIV